MLTFFKAIYPRNEMHDRYRLKNFKPKVKTLKQFYNILFAVWWMVEKTFIRNSVLKNEIKTRENIF